MRERYTAFMLALLGLLLAACEEAPDHSIDRVHHEHPSMPVDEAASGLSIFQLDSVWTDQHGREMPLRDLSGRVLVLAMVYTHCEAACPRIIADMRRIHEALGTRGDRVSLVLVSIDPDRDDVERLREFGESTGLTARGWTLLRGDESAVRELAAVFGLQYRRTSETDFAHSNLINVIDAKGEIAHQQKGLGVDPNDTAAAIRGLLASRD